jgi:hypothetical protein
MSPVIRLEGDPMSNDVAPEMTVEFRMPADHLDAKHVHLVGEFNAWSKTATPMTRVGNHFVASISLAAGRTYRYKFLVDGERWENDWTADAYVSNEYGGDDSVLDLTTARPAPSEPAAPVDPDSPGAAIDVVDGEIPEPNEPA